jgi:cytochrome b
MDTTQKRIWDLPVRLTHWSLVVSFFGAFFTAELRPTIIHEFFAFACLTLVTFRVLWGLVGSDTARFTHFVKGYGAATAYLKGLAKFKHTPHWGHNPLGALAIMSILGLMFALVGAGLFASTSSYTGPWTNSVSKGLASVLNETHELLATVLMTIVVIHIVAVVAYRVFFKDNLITPMVKGVKEAPADFQEPRFGPTWLAAILFLISLAGTGAVFRFWVF